MFKKKIVLTALIFLVLACSSEPKEAIVMGMGLPLTGKMADYGQKTKKGAELALQEINASGGINGRPLEIDFQDDQADPKQAVAVAQKFITNPKVLVASEFGSVPAMAAAPLYQKAGLTLCVFLGRPDVTDIGDYIWGTDISVSKNAYFFASYIKDLGIKKPALFFLNNDWGKNQSNHVAQYLAQLGIQVSLLEAYLPDETDFRPLVSKAKAQGVDGFSLVSYLPDASLLTQQIRSQGLTQPICTSSSIAVGNQFPQMAGRSAEGVYLSGTFYPDESKPEVAQLMKRWKAKYPQEEMAYYSIHTYDSTILVAYALRLSDGTRASVRKAMAQLKDVPSVVNHKVSFDPITRRIEKLLGARLVVKDGQVVPFQTNQKE